MKQKIVRRASALVLAGCLLAGAALPALAASAKEEVIYANLDASGTVTGVYAVNSFAVQAGDHSCRTRCPYCRQGVCLRCSL